MTEKKKRMTLKSQAKMAEVVEMSAWLARVQKAHDEADEEKGACLLKDPVTGQLFCSRTTQTLCAQQKGKWIGGPCGA